MDRPPGQLQLSAILNMLADFDVIRKTVRHLCAQTVSKHLELVIVATSETASLIDAEALAPLGAWQVVTADTFPSAAAAWAAGIRRARAPLVVLAEDHSYPEPGWAEALIEAHQQDYAAVTPVIRNGNPRSTISCANYLLCFIEWFWAERSQEVRFGAGHNCSYKRDVLASYDLEKWLVSEVLLHFDFAARGLRILIEPRAVTHHVNISIARSYLAQSFYGGRVFGGSRAANWSTARAWIYALAFPLVPAVRLSRIWNHLDTPDKRRHCRFWASLPWTLAGLLLHAVGEATGYILGAGNASDHYMSFELFRRNHVSAEDMPLLMAQWGRLQPARDLSPAAEKAG